MACAAIMCAIAIVSMIAILYTWSQSWVSVCNLNVDFIIKENCHYLINIEYDTQLIRV